MVEGCAIEPYRGMSRRRRSGTYKGPIAVRAYNRPTRSLHPQESLEPSELEVVLVTETIFATSQHLLFGR